MLTNIAVFYNPYAGRIKTAAAQKALDAFRQRGHVLTLVETQNRQFHDGPNPDYIKAIEGQDALLIMGGDGTVMNVLNGLGNALTIPFSVLPLGTINLLAREMGITTQNCADTFHKDAVQTIHLGLINDRLFCITTGVGVDASAVAEVDVTLKGKIGRLAYIVSLYKSLKHCKDDLFSVTCNGQTYSAKAVLVMNGKYYAGSYRLGRQTSLLKEGFEIYLLKKNSLASLIKYGFLMMFSRLHHSKDAITLQSNDIKIDARKPSVVQLDGDIGPALPIHIKTFKHPYQILRKTSPLP